MSWIKFGEFVKFREGNLDEVSTSTANVAQFSRRVGEVVRRNKKNIDYILGKDEEDDNNETK